MDISTDNINNLVKCLQATLSAVHSERKQGLYCRKLKNYFNSVLNV